MSRHEPRVKFLGQEFLFIGDAGRTDGAIATPEQYANFEVSFAHLFPDGVIRRFGERIGTREDLTWIEEENL